MTATINGLDGNPFTSRDIDASPNNFIFTFHKIVLSGNYVAGGDTLDLSTITAQVPSGSAPLSAFAEDNSGAAGFAFTGGYFAVLSGTTLSNWKLKIFNAAGGEFAAGAYSAALLASNIVLNLQWRKLL